MISKSKTIKYVVVVLVMLALIGSNSLNVSAAKVLKNGVRDQAVVTLKKDLGQAGFSVPGKGTTLFGKDTEQKVREFQSYYKLQVDGIADSGTISTLKSVVDSPLQKGKRHSNTKTLKRDLAAIGYPVPGNGTTLYGTDTEKVVKKFQKDNKLVVNGIADDITLAKIASLKNSGSSVLQNGVRHSSVKTLKVNLGILGFPVPGNGTTLFGKDTEKKVKEFQKYYALKQSGTVTKETDNKIKQILASPLQNGKRHQDTKKLKVDLGMIGYPVPGNGTTLYGKDTEKVVKKFQKDKKLIVNGIADEVTLKKIAELKKSSTPILSDGVRHASVKKLKADLKKVGFPVPGNGTTLYGKDTTAVVKSFQNYFKLTADGVAGPDTLNKLKSIVNSPLQNGVRHKDTKQLKKDLGKLGYKVPGNGTTLYGKDTEKVVKKFQKDKKLTVNGIADEITLAKIASLIKAMENEKPSEPEIPETKPVNKTEYTAHKYTFNQAIDFQMFIDTKANIARNYTDKYRNDPAYIEAKYVEFTGKAKTVRNNINIRSQPKLGSTYKKAKLNNGTAIEIVSSTTGSVHAGSDKWYKIKYNKKEYYIHSAYVTGTTGKVSKGEGIGTTTSEKNRVRVYQGKKKTSHVFKHLLLRNKVNIVGSTSGSWYEIKLDGWRYPTRQDVTSYLTPTNHNKMQHLRLDSVVGATATELNKMVANQGILNKKGASYRKGARAHGVNEIYLIAHSFLETGRGTSALSTGVEVGRQSNGSLVLVTDSNRKILKNIKKTYNMFGIGAVDSNALLGGAVRAYNEGWTTPEKAIEGGAAFVKEGYISKTLSTNKDEVLQNTLYKMKWNPENHWRQYATDIGWAVKQANIMTDLYKHVKKPSYHYDIVQYK